MHTRRLAEHGPGRGPTAIIINTSEMRMPAELSCRTAETRCVTVSGPPTLRFSVWSGWQPVMQRRRHVNSLALQDRGTQDTA